MRSVSLRLDDLRLVTIYLGFAGENEHTTVFFDCKKAFDQYPNAVPALTVKPPKGEPYPSVVTREEDIVSWTVTASDLIEDGDGEIQLSFVENGVVMKSYTSATKIYRSIVPTGDIPTPVEDWIIRAQEILGSVPNVIADALQEAKDSGEFDGVGITNIEKTATEGLVDTYIITLTDGSVKQFTVTNGYSPVATVSKQGKTTTLSVTDINGTTTAEIQDGESNYDLLTNRPKINNVELVGNKTTEELGLPTKVSDLQNDSGFLTEETDPTVPAWAKQSTKPTYTAQEVGALPADTFIPSNISDLTNDSGYLTTETDPTVPNWAKAPQKPTYTANEVGALPDNTFIPSRVSDLTDDSGHYTKPAGGIPASDLANGVLDVWSGLTYHRSSMSTDSDSFVLGAATDSPTEINRCTVTSTPTPNIIPKFDYQGRLHSVTPEDEWDGSNAVATTQYVDTMISNNMPDVPTAVSELDNDAGYLVADDIAGKANSADLATVATSGSYNDLTNKPTIPTNVSQLTNDSGYLTQETDPTVPAWAKSPNKPTYTAAEVGATTTSDVNSLIASAIGNINSFDVEVVQSLPSQNIKEHTIYFVPKTGETNDVYDEYIYINNQWEMIGNTQIDLSTKADKTDTVLDTTLSRGRRGSSTVGTGSFAFGNIVVASGSWSHAEGNAAMASGTGAHAEGQATTASGAASHAEGWAVEASGDYAHSEGRDTIASADYAHAEGVGSQASGQTSHAEGVQTKASANAAHAEGYGTQANAENTHSEGQATVANGESSHAEGAYNVADSYTDWPEWAANTSYAVGDKVKVTTTEDNETVIKGYICKTANSDSSFIASKWILDKRMNYVHIIGNGTNINRSNAYALDWNGNGHFGGDIYVNCSSDSTGGVKLLSTNDVLVASTAETQAIISEYGVST